MVTPPISTSYTTTSTSQEWLEIRQQKYRTHKIIDQDENIFCGAIEHKQDPRYTDDPKTTPTASQNKECSVIEDR